MQEYAVYKGDTFICVGTAQECANAIGKSAHYIRWLTMPSVVKKLETRKNPEKCLVVIKLEET